jgi:glycogen synthase
MADAAGIPSLDVEIGEFALEWMLDVDDFDRQVETSGCWLLALAARVRPDIVHLNGFAHGVLPFHVPTITVAHSCLLSWRDANGGEFDPPRLGTYRQIVTAGLRGATWVVSPTAAMLRALQAHYGPLERTTVIANGRDVDVASVTKEPLVVTAGRLWDRAKNVAAVRIIEQRLPWPVAIAGSEAVGAPQLPRDSVLALLARASIFALPARYEPFGLLPLEAALAGCVLVLGDIPTLREVWGDAAVYVDPENPDALERALRTLIDVPAWRAEMASRAGQRARRYTTTAMAERYMELYASIGDSRRCA